MALRAGAAPIVAAEADDRAMDEAIGKAAASPASIAMSRAVASLVRGTAASAAAGEASLGVGRLTSVAGPANLPAFAIVANAENATVAENLLAWTASGYAGILAARGTRSVAGNDLLMRGRAVPGEPTTGITLPVAAGVGFGIVVGLGANVAPGAEGCDVDGNVLLGSLIGILVGQVELVTVRGNLLARSAVGIAASLADAPRIDANLVHSAERGMLLIETTRARISGNHIVASRQEGIQVIGVGRQVPPGPLWISGNTLRHCGAAEEQASAIVASLLDPVAGEEDASAGGQDLVIEHNLVAETGVPLGGKGPRAARSIAVALAAPRVTVHGNAIQWEMAARTPGGQKLLAEEGAKANRALLVVPAPAQGLDPSAGERFGGTVSITDNRMRGFAMDSLVELREGAQPPGRFSAVMFGTNLVEHWGPLDVPGAALPATVVLRGEPGATVAVAGNVVRGPGRRPSFLVDGPKEVAYAGNATTGPLLGAAPQMNVIV